VRASLAVLIRLERSEVYNNESGGLVISGSEFRIVNNFIRHNGRYLSDVGGIKFDPSAGVTQGSFVNNTLFGNRARTGAAAQCGQTLVLANNIIFGNVEPDGDTGGTRVSSVVGCVPTHSVAQAEDVAVLSQDADADTTPPVFVNDGTEEPELVDLHLEAGSGGLGRGDLGVAPSDDFDGQPRGGGIDVGADQISGL
jgi:hypothetical protein